MQDFAWKADGRKGAPFPAKLMMDDEAMTTMPLMPRWMRLLPVLLLLSVFACPVLLLVSRLAVADPTLPADLAAAHPDGKWRIKKAQLYSYLVKYYGAHPSSKLILDDYLKVRFVQMEARRRKIRVTDRAVAMWIRDLETKIRKKTGGVQTLDSVSKQLGMTRRALIRRSKSAILRERIARAVYLEKDPTRNPSREVTEADVQLVIDKLYEKADKSTSATRLPRNVVARLQGTDITVYDFGRELYFGLGERMILQALNQLIDIEQVRLLVGNDDPPTEAMMNAQKLWFMERQRALLRRQVKDPSVPITPELVDRSLARFGLSRKLIYGSLSFKAEARGRAHFQTALSDKEVLKFFEDNRGRYGDRVRVQRIFVKARAQRQVNIGGQKARNLEQGKARAQALWIRVTRGADFRKVAEKESDDMPAIKKRGGVVPIWLHKGLPGYEETFLAADRLKVDEIGPVFYSRRGGFVIIKLLERKKGGKFVEIRDRVRADAGDRAHHLWRTKARQSALKAKTLLDER